MKTAGFMRLALWIALLGLCIAPALAQSPAGSSDSDAASQATISQLLANAQQRGQDLDGQIAALNAGQVPAGQDAATARANLLDLKFRNDRVIADCQRRLSGGASGPAAPSSSNAPSIPYSGPRSPFDSTFGVNYASQSGPADQPSGGSSGGSSGLLSLLGGSSDWRVMAISTGLGLAGYFIGAHFGGFWGGMVGSLIGGIGGQWLAQKIVDKFFSKPGDAGTSDTQPPAPAPAPQGPPGGQWSGAPGPNGWQGVPPAPQLPPSGPLPTDPSAAYQEMQSRYTQFQQVTDSGASAATVAAAYQNYLVAKHNYDTLLTGAGR